MNLCTWMAEISDSREVFALNLVGTHDCVTKYVQLSYFTRCQNKSIAEQLKLGIRALDIRCCSRGDRLKLLHGIAKAYNSPNRLSPQMDMADVLRQCYAFLDENPTETIIFQFKNDNCQEMERCFDNLYNTYILPDSDRWLLENRSPSLGEARGKLILVRRCSKYDDREYPLGTGIDFSGWQEQDEITPDALPLNTAGDAPMKFLIQDRYKYKPVARWQECLKPFLDSMKEFCGEYIINYTSTAGGIGGPRNNARYINKRLMEYSFNSDYYYGIVYTDFPQPELVEKIISTNREN